MPKITAILAIVLADDAAAGFPASGAGSLPTTVTQALLKCETNNVRLGDVDNVPTAAIGYLWTVGETLLFVGNDYGQFLKNLRIINAVAGSNGTIRGVAMTGFDKA